ncbi:bifunctional lysylphosphatidylglycerol flippase/synthetase MprF [Telmatospirillum sp.]|uniref:bifunctional lysylphosphatidylglycerol flippase/synthetase MprF n=1 Tax=Telmatospirillum sp. TaxID=2079197 RepID=UPI002840ECD7|nr:bifunctional lysylphosphatidylglycerol flippase/synthetase MprF [Telmatospirillum sp.]MDR3437251.1 bifunctional lysylphosphatidylglycerol flippase/synthetase MprF [Telmatospirillum sp.]
MSKILRGLVALSSVVVFGLALWVLHHALQQFSLADVQRALHRTPWPAIGISVLATILSYWALTGFDSLAAHYVGAKLPYRRIALASFISQAISHSTGFAALTGTSIRYRLYSNAGISAGDVARIVGFCALTFGLGAICVVTAAMLLEPRPVGIAVALHAGLVHNIGFAFLAALVAYAAVTAGGRRSLSFGRLQVTLPSWKMTGAQTLLAVIDLAFAAAALYLLLPPVAKPSFLAFLGLYAVAILAGVVSHVPGGLGVFEGLMVVMLPQLPPTQVLGSLVLYRAIYNLLPLVIAAASLGLIELLQRGRAFAATARWLGGTIEALSPSLFAAMALLGGAVLLWSGATPAVPIRLETLANILPLPIIEISHLAGSVVGVWLLLLARGLFRRLDGAYWLTCGLYSAGIVFSLLKGFDWEEASLMAILLVGLAPARRAFYRRASLIQQRFTLSWAAAIVTVVSGSIWLAMFSFQHHVYSRQMWWHFAFASEAPRALRASVAVAVVAGAYMLSRLLAPARQRARPADAHQLAQAKAIAMASPSADAQIALLGDKSFLFNPAGNAFLMYGVSGRSWVALGDPVGPRAEWPDLIWQFREMVDQVAGWPVFYQVSPQALPFYLDLGLSFAKLGEEARVHLDGFSLQGPTRSELRYGYKRAQKDGATFEVIPADAVPAVLDDLRAVSDEWLEKRHTREKGFSLGTFDPAYLGNFPCALVRRQDKIVAFANLWLSGDEEEIAIDLMRHTQDSGYGVMDYLFIEAMLWGQAQGYHWFSFGIAPLSGMRDNALAPLWNRVGAFLYRHGEDLYNFQGLRRYKEKFLPEWEPRFMASPGGLALPRVAADVAALISGGVKGLVTK